MIKSHRYDTPIGAPTKWLGCGHRIQPDPFSKNICDWGIYAYLCDANVTKTQASHKYPTSTPQVEDKLHTDNSEIKSNNVSMVHWWI